MSIIKREILGLQITHLDFETFQELSWYFQPNALEMHLKLLMLGPKYYHLTSLFLVHASEKYYCLILTLSIKSKNIHGRNPRKHSHLSEQTLYTYNIVTADEEFCNCQQVYRCTKHRYRQRRERCELVNHHSFEIWTLVKQLFFFLFLCVVEMWTLVKHSFQTCACQTYFWGNNLSNIVLKCGHCACHSFRKWEFVKHHSVE